MSVHRIHPFEVKGGMALQRQVLGRGDIATRDMKLRVGKLRADGADVVGVLWARFAASHIGELKYDHAERQEPELV